MEAPITNIDQLSKDLCELYQELRERKIEPGIVKELNNTAGKILNANKLILEYEIYLKRNREILFLEPNKD